MSKIIVRHPRNKNYLYLGLGLFVGLILLIYFLPPVNFINLILFYALVFGEVFYLVYFVSNNKRTAFLISAGITLLLVLRQLGLRHFIYPFLILALILSLEVKWRID